MHITVSESREAYEIAKAITQPGIYFTDSVFICNQTRSTTTIDKKPYAYG
jgi:hydroxyacylglutathione hydrolase